MNTFSETQSLLKNSNFNKKWNNKVLKWTFSIVLFGLLLLGAIYLVYIFTGTTTQLKSNATIKKNNSLHITSIATTNDDFLKKCAPIVKCDPNAKYRSINGSCNNLGIPTWGAAETPFMRMLDANYSDGYYAFRLQTNGSALPSGRIIDVKVFLNHETYRVDENNVLLFPFTQSIAHDISGLPNNIILDKDGIAVDCCSAENKKEIYPSCTTIIESIDDPVYSAFNVTCTGLYRSVTSRNYDCPLYPTTFINNNTHFIDASEVYGSNEMHAQNLRTMDGGRLNFTISDNGQMFCPFKNNVQPMIGNPKSFLNYDTGDPNNGNQNLGITSMQTLFLRFHNYVALKLSSLNPFWSDEIIYQESRRIVIATIQRVIYEDLLPIIIGDDFQELYGLNQPNIYDPNINPSTSQEFSTAAYRVLHAIIPVQLNFMNKDYKIENMVKITDWMVNSELLPIDDNFEKLLKGFIETPGRMVQPSYNFYISNFMFPSLNNTLIAIPNLSEQFNFYTPSFGGRDLLSIDIVRGRDVGLQPYNRVRHFCGYPLANNFEDLADLIHIKAIAQLKELYSSVNDIDLIVGLLLEKHSDGAIVGPTARCLIADGFYRYKAGDRFFYDVQGQPGSFTDDQLKTIKKITLSHVLCATTNVDHVQKDIFKMVDHNLFPTLKRKCDKEPLLKKENTQYKKWYQKLFKWPFNVIWFGVLLLGAVYVLYILINDDIQSNSSNVPKSKSSLHIASIATTNDDFLKKCAPIVKCDPNAKYRSLNGSCNNLKTPTWGAATTPFLRLLDANFSDGYYGIRVQTNGSALPYPRVLDVNIFLSREIYRGDENNVLLLPFGQLLAHDISGLPNDLVLDENGDAIDCCLTENKKKNYTQCQIVLENLPDDPVYSAHNKTCTPIFRSLTSRNYSCSLYPTAFINDNTHFIDASAVYGSNESYALHLRDMVGGRLKFSISDNGQMFCPFLTDQNIQNNVSIENKKTHIEYDTGDPNNGNQNFGITAMQTLFLRFHNYIAFKLSSLNPHWSDEELYQESRRIVIATIQRILYEDFLPIIIGDDFQEIYGLNEENIYDPTINPSTSLEFSSAASRVLHAIIPTEFNFMNKDYEIENSTKITDWMLKSDLIPLDDNFDKLLKGFIETPGRMVQPSYNFYISNYMLVLPNNPDYNGRDLLAIDIARGRDVGLQPYNQVRHFCGFPLAKDFEDLADLIHIKDVMKLKKNYYSVNDIDLMVGILLEEHSRGAIVGPTTRCLIADGFYRYKAGDRFFYDVQGQPGSFTDDQLKTIKKITLGHVVCATSNVDHVQKDIFKVVDHNLFSSVKMKCDEEFNLNFKAWEEVNNHPEL
ncbi:hypothetical protein QTP88_004701 [Uroleucon formosanum]